MRFAKIILVLNNSRTIDCLTAALVLCSALSYGSRSYGQVERVSFIPPVEVPHDLASPTVQVAQSSDLDEPSVSAGQVAVTVPSLSPDDIARLAASNASLAVLMRGDLRADQAGVIRPSKRQQAILELRSKVQEFRIARQSQMVASQALELHFALATLAALEPIQQELAGLLTIHRERQARAIERGLSILDPTALDRLLASARDVQLQSDFKNSQLRSQLALLVDPSIACHYVPEPMSIPEPVAAVDQCQMIELAMRQRCDLAGLVYLRSHLDDETLEVARWMSDILSGSATFVAGLASRPFTLLGFVLPKEKNARHEELCARLAVLDQAIKSLREKIASEVNIALDKQSIAAQRFANTSQLVEAWQTRLAQLRAYGDQVKAQPADELEAEMQLLQARSELVQRQGDWHQAIVELALAVGCVP